MKIEFMRGTFWEGKDYVPGDVIEVSKFDASWLISCQKAKIFTESVDRSVGLTTSSAQPLVTRRTYKKRGGQSK